MIEIISFHKEIQQFTKLFLVYLAEIHKKYHYEPSAIKRNRNGKQECSSSQKRGSLRIIYTMVVPPLLIYPKSWI